MKLFTSKSIETVKCRQESRVLWLLFAECIMGQACIYILSELQAFSVSVVTIVSIWFD